MNNKAHPTEGVSVCVWVCTHTHTYTPSEIRSFQLASRGAKKAMDTQLGLSSDLASSDCQECQDLFECWYRREWESWPENLMSLRYSEISQWMGDLYFPSVQSELHSNSPIHEYPFCLSSISTCLLFSHYDVFIYLHIEVSMAGFYVWFKEHFMTWQDCTPFHWLLLCISGKLMTSEWILEIQVAYKYAFSFHQSFPLCLDF